MTDDKSANVPVYEADRGSSSRGTGPLANKENGATNKARLPQGVSKAFEFRKTQRR